MGRIGTILSFSRVERNGAKVSDVKIDLGGGAIITGEHFAPPGDDSFPLKTDYVITSKLPQTGNKAIIGYIDPLSEPVALEGDKRIYARQSDGVTVAEVWLKNDGSILISNGSGSVELQSGGTIDLNGVTIDPSGNIVTPGTLNADDVTADNLDVTLSTHLTSGVAPTPGT